MHLSWLDSTRIETAVRWLTLAGLGLLSPVRGLTEALLSPYLHLGNPVQWTDEITKLLTLSPDAIQCKLLPTLFICVFANLVYLLLCQKLAKQLSQRLKQHLGTTETPSA